MKSHQFKFGYDLTLEAGAVLKPTQFHVWKSQNNHEHHGPMKYLTDALLGFSYFALNTGTDHPLAEQSRQFWNEVEPHLKLHAESQRRVKSIQQKIPSTQNKVIQNFEKSFLSTLQNAFHKDHFELKDLTGLLDCIQYLESESNQPVLYNFSCQFSPEFTKTLQALDSFLFHLRSLVAYDFNNHIQDPSHEAIKVDSVTDYLPKGDYIVSDAVLYWQFKKLTYPFVAGNRSDIRIEKLMVQPLKSLFNQYVHNACVLVDHLPESFLSALNVHDMEEALYLVQMDWLLGTGTGLLFKIREELYGLQNGYEKIFWPELEGRTSQRPAKLTLGLEFSTAQILGGKKAA